MYSVSWNYQPRPSTATKFWLSLCIYAGSPFQFNVTDASKLAAAGDGLGMVACNRPTMFTIMAPGASRADLDVKIIGRVKGQQLLPASQTNLTSHHK